MQTTKSMVIWLGQSCRCVLLNRLVCRLASTKSAKALLNQRLMRTKTASFMPFLRASRSTTSSEWLLAIWLREGGEGALFRGWCRLMFDDGEDWGGIALLQLAKVCCLIASSWLQVLSCGRALRLNSCQQIRVPDRGVIGIQVGKSVRHHFSTTWLALTCCLCPWFDKELPLCCEEFLFLKRREDFFSQVLPEH